MPRVSEEQEKAIVAARKKGATWGDLQKQYGISRTELARVLKAHGVSQGPMLKGTTEHTRGDDALKDFVPKAKAKPTRPKDLAGGQERRFRCGACGTVMILEPEEALPGACPHCAVELSAHA